MGPNDRIAGEVADGMIIHPFSTQTYIDSVTLPAIEQDWPRRVSLAKDLNYPILVLWLPAATKIYKSKVATQKAFALRLYTRI